jgi:hypothetical protein
MTSSRVAEILGRQAYRIVGWFPPSVFFAHRPLRLGRD